MPIPTHKTADQLRNACDRRMRGAHPSASQTTENFETPVVDERQRLEDLLSTRSQVALFRAENGVDWAQSFTPVETFRRNFTLFGYSGVELVEHLWNQLPSCRFKRFNELFCERKDYAVPRFDPIAPCVVYPARHELNQLSLSGCLVSPARIPFKLLVDLGIVPEPQSKLSDLQALEIKSQPHVIASLKAIFESAECLRPGNERILVVKQINTERYPNAAELPEATVGSVLYLRENSAINRTGPKRDRSVWHAPEQIVAFFPSLYNALRKTDHEESGYQLETMTLGELSVEWSELRTRARREWLPEASQVIKDGIRRDFQLLLAKSREELRGVSHHLKREAAELFAALEDRLSAGSNNITAHIARIDGSVRRLTRTRDTSSRKAGYNNTDAKQLGATIQSAEHGFKIIANSLFGAGKRLEFEMKKKGGYFSQADLGSIERERGANLLLNQLRIPMAAVENVHHRPLRAFATQLQVAYDQLKDAVLNQDVEQTKRSMVKLVVVSKLQSANSVFELLRRFTGSAEGVPLKDVIRHSAALRSKMELRSVFPETLVPELQGAYERVGSTASMIASKLERCKQRGIDLTEHTKTYADIRESLDQTDVEGEVRSLQI